MDPGGNQLCNSSVSCDSFQEKIEQGRDWNTTDAENVSLLVCTGQRRPDVITGSFICQIVRE